MAPIINSLSAADCIAWLRRHVSDPQFATVNPQLSAAELSLLKSPLPVFPPRKPTFSFLVPSGSGDSFYQQARINNVKYRLIQVAYKYFHCSILLPGLP
jgi:hypothetical protein